jgi:DNA topoisomerase-3
VKSGETVQTTAVEVKQNQTKPPARFTKRPCSAPWKALGKLVEDEELREAMSEKGLGTPATRAAIIEGLITEVYMLRVGKELQPTAKAFSLMELLNGLGIAELTKPELTGEWEHRLRQVQKRQVSREEFMGQIAELTRHIVGRAKQYEHDTIPAILAFSRSVVPMRW